MLLFVNHLNEDSYIFRLLSFTDIFISRAYIISNKQTFRRFLTLINDIFFRAQTIPLNFWRIQRPVELCPSGSCTGPPDRRIKYLTWILLILGFQKTLKKNLMNMKKSTVKIEKNDNRKITKDGLPFN